MDIAKKLHNVFSESKLQGDTVIFPDWNITLLPRIETLDAIKDLDKKSVEISFRISDPNFDQELYEYQVGFAEDQDTAIAWHLEVLQSA
ncbi:hypothetical protein [Neobacillus niacini]|uniref:hypothetical protein n=1 Tax=Neobacillus niacini TaxID=86668 RepID=UPI0005ED8AA7|nr:hypothetical protein [Neobacillus niacini]